MIKQTFKDIVTDELLHGAILIDGFKGFLEDYKVLHCLLKIHNPKSVFEIGTSVGNGTNLITHALPDAVVYSLDMPVGMGDKPLYDGKDHTGENCKFPFTQLRGDSTDFDYSRFPAECYFVDAGHFYDNVLAETKGVLAQNPLLIIYHDTDIPEVMQAIIDGMNEDYELFKITDTRISYLIKKRYGCL